MRRRRLEGVDQWPSLGWAAVAWIETFLRHGPGDVVGEPIELDDEFVAFIVDAYRVYPAGHPRAGRRVYRRAVLSRPKGRAKSELAGMIVCWEALGECRFDHWARAGERSWWGYEYDAGEPVGRPVASPFIRCLATEYGQSGNTFDNVREMLSHDTLAGAYGFRKDTVGRTRVFLPDGGVILPSTASGASKDGGKESFSVADETHLYELDELRDMYRVVSRNLRKRRIAEPWMLETTTAHRPGMDSIAERAAEWARRLGDREAQAAAGLLYDHREAPPVDDIRDPRQVIPALKEVYGPFAAVMDLEAIAAEIQDPAVDEADARRFWLNQTTSGANAWWTEQQLTEIFSDEVALEPGEPICLGWDGSREHDATALVACTRDSRIVPLAIWQHDGSVDWEVPEHEAHEAVEAAHDEYRVVLAYGDPPYWETEIAAWSSRWPRRWRRWPTQSERRMADAVAALTHSARAGGVRCGPGDFGQLLWEHWRHAQRKPIVGAAAVRAQRAGHAAPFVLVKDRKGSPRKIDAAVASVLAHEAARDAHTAGLWARVRRRRTARMRALIR